MGCGGIPSTIETPNKKEKQKQDTIILIYLEVLELIKKNPFYNIEINEFSTEINLRIEDNNPNVDIITDSILKKYFFDSKNFIKNMFLNVTKEAYNKFKYIYPNEKDLIVYIYYLLFFFLSKAHPGKKKSFKNKLTYLFNNIKEKENKKDINQNENVIKNENEDEKEDKYNFKIGKFLFLVLNLIQFCTFSFIYFFVSVSVFDILANYELQKFDEIFGSKKLIQNPDEINYYLNSELLKMNKNFRPNYINSLALSEIMNKIENIINKNTDINNNNYFTLNNDEINEIFDIIINLIDINNYVDFFFYGENHNF